MKLTIYMKSGNTINVSGVVNYKIENKGNEIVSLEIEQKFKFLGVFPRNMLLIKTVALDQIEAIVKQ